MTKLNTTDIIKLDVTNSANTGENAELCGFSSAMAEKLKQIADNGGGGGGSSSLTGIDALASLDEQFKAKTTDAFLSLDNSYAEVVTDGKMVLLDFALEFTTSTATTQVIHDIVFNIDNPLGKPLSQHFHYVPIMQRTTSDQLSTKTQYGAYLSYDAGTDKIVLTIPLMNVSNTNLFLTQFYLGIFPSSL